MNHSVEGGDQSAKDCQVKGPMIPQSKFQGKGADQHFGQTGYDAQGPSSL